MASLAFIAALTCLLALAPEAVVGEKISIEWTPEGVRAYNLTHPLQVERGDNLEINCSATGNYRYSNVWILQDERQYNECDCNVAPDSECGSVARNGFCFPGFSRIIITINNIGGSLSNVLNFIPGETYYFVSYCRDLTLDAAMSLEASGGQCTEGLRLALQVASLPTLPPTTANTAANITSTPQPSTSATTIAHGSLTPGGTSEDVISVGDTDSNVFNEPMNTTFASLESTLVILDWHIAVIAVLAAVIASGALISVILIAVRLSWLRRKRKLDFEKGGEKPSSSDNGVVPSTEKQDLGTTTVALGSTNTEKTDLGTNTAAPQHYGDLSKPFDDPLDTN